MNAYRKSSTWGTPPSGRTSVLRDEQPANIDLKLLAPETVSLLKSADTRFEHPSNIPQASAGSMTPSSNTTDVISVARSLQGVEALLLP